MITGFMVGVFVGAVIGVAIMSMMYIGRGDE